MNETKPDQDQPVEQTTTSPAKKPKSNSKKVLLVLLVVMLLAASLFGVWYIQQRKINDLDQQINDLTSKSAQEPADISQPTIEPESITKGLPNGQKITYPLNANNADVMWWSSDYINNEAGNKDFIYLSSQKIVRFLATVPSAKQQEVCGETMYMNITAFQMGALTISTKKLSLQQQYLNCVQVLAENNDATYGAAAKALDTEVKQQLQSFVDSAVIQ